MTERGLPIVDGAPACPFVAFEDDRDERATSPDHRHRCYAEPTPAPRALAHQEAYCLSSAFPVCPTFQDWARREAARSRGEGPRPTDSDAAAIAAGPPQRNPPRNWAAPPPWLSRGGGPGGLWDDDDDEGEADDRDPSIPRRGRGLSGSLADRMAADADAAALGGLSPPDADADDGAIDAVGPVPPVPPASYPPPTRPTPSLPDAFDDDRADGEPPRSRHRERDPGRVAAFGGGGERHATEPQRPANGEAPAARHERRRDADAPEWERARPAEAYPTLRARRLPELSLPPLLVAVVALALAAAILFALPGLLGFGNPSAQATPTPTTRPSSSATQAPTPVPQPTQQIYTVQAGDTMSRIAGRFGIPLGDLIAANAGNIPNPDQLQIGDQVIIPVLSSVPSQLPGASTAP